MFIIIILFIIIIRFRAHGRGESVLYFVRRWEWRAARSNIRHFHNHDRQQHFSVIIIVTIIILRDIHIYTFIPTIYTDIYKYIHTYIQIYTYLHTNIYKFVLSFCFLACVTGKTLSFL